jgi:hypothetical protein
MVKQVNAQQKQAPACAEYCCSKSSNLLRWMPHSLLSGDVCSVVRVSTRKSNDIALNANPRPVMDDITNAYCLIAIFPTGTRSFGALLPSTTRKTAKQATWHAINRAPRISCVRIVVSIATENNLQVSRIYVDS